MKPQCRECEYWYLNDMSEWTKRRTHDERR